MTSDPDHRDFTRLPEPVRLEDTVAGVPSGPSVDRVVGDPEQDFVLRHGAG